MLDDHAKPRGYVTRTSLTQCVEEGVDIRRALGEVMTPFLTRVAPSLSVSEAAQLVARSLSGFLVVIDVDGSMLGVVAAADLPKLERVSGR